MKGLTLTCSGVICSAVQGYACKPQPPAAKHLPSMAMLAEFCHISTPVSSATQDMHVGVYSVARRSRRAQTWAGTATGRAKGRVRCGEVHVCAEFRSCACTSADTEQQAGQ